MTLEMWLRHQNVRPAEFARRIGVAHTTVARWLDNTSPPSKASIDAIYRATEGQVTASDLLGQVAA